MSGNLNRICATARAGLIVSDHASAHAANVKTRCFIGTQARYSRPSCVCFSPLSPPSAFAHPLANSCANARVEFFNYSEIRSTEKSSRARIRIFRTTAIPSDFSASPLLTLFSGVCPTLRYRSLPLSVALIHG